MGNRFASGRIAIAMCDRCGFQYQLKQLKRLIIKTKNINLLVCPECWEPDQPQLQLGMYPVDDPQALRNPRRDNSYVEAGLTGLQLVNTSGQAQNQDGGPSGGSRDIQWGWNPVGLYNPLLLPIPNNLISVGQIGTVTVTIT